MTFTITFKGWPDRQDVRVDTFAEAQAAAGWGRRQVLGRSDTCGTCAEGVRRMAEDTSVPSRRKVTPPAWWGIR